MIRKMIRKIMMIKMKMNMKKMMINK